MLRPTYYECGVCGALHNAALDAECRDDDTRLGADFLDHIHGPNGWDEIRASEVAAWRAGVAQQRETTDHE